MELTGGMHGAGGCALVAVCGGHHPQQKHHQHHHSPLAVTKCCCPLLLPASGRQLSALRDASRPPDTRASVAAQPALAAVTHPVAGHHAFQPHDQQHQQHAALTAAHSKQRCAPEAAHVHTWTPPVGAAWR